MGRFPILGKIRARHFQRLERIVTPRFAITWVLGHGLIIAALSGVLFLVGWEVAAGWAFYAMPLAIGIFQAFMLRPHVRLGLWLPLTWIGFFASYLFSWIYIFAIGFTMSFAQAFCFRTRPCFVVCFMWTVLGTLGWPAGLLLGGKLANPHDCSGIVLYLVAVPVYSAFLLPVLLILSRRHSACPAPAGSPILPPT